MSSPTLNSQCLSGPGFHQLVRLQFGRHAPHYNDLAQLQRGIAWRLAHHCRGLTIPAGPRADLGAGSGLVGSAWSAQLANQPAQPAATPQAPPPHAPPSQAPLLQVDLCPELLARNPLAPSQGALVWDLNNDLPPTLRQAALLTSSFALQWLDDPGAQLEHWCSTLQGGGWLALAVPTCGSFPQWRQAAQRAGVPFTGLELPSAEQLAQRAGRHLQLAHCRQLHFSRSHANGLSFLRQIRQLGAGASRHGPLTAPQLRRLLQHWPSPSSQNWQVLLLVGQRQL